MALIERGYRNIAFVSEQDDEWTRGAARRAGFQEAMHNAGLSAHRMIRYGQPPMTIEDGYKLGSEFNQHFADADCIFLYLMPPHLVCFPRSRRRTSEYPRILH